MVAAAGNSSCRRSVGTWLLLAGSWPFGGGGPSSVVGTSSKLTVIVVGNPGSYIHLALFASFSSVSSSSYHLEPPLLLPRSNLVTKLAPKLIWSGRGLLSSA